MNFIMIGQLLREALDRLCVRLNIVSCYNYGLLTLWGCCLNGDWKEECCTVACVGFLKFVIYSARFAVLLSQLVCPVTSTLSPAWLPRPAQLLWSLSQTQQIIIIIILSNALHSSIGQNIKSLACPLCDIRSPISDLRCPARVWKTSNGHNAQRVIRSTSCLALGWVF